MAMTDSPKSEAPKAAPAAADAPLPVQAAWLTPAYMIGLLAVFAGERIFASYDWARYALSGLGVVAVVGSTVLRFTSASTRDEQRRDAELTLGKLSAGGVLALCVYFATTEAGKKLLGVPGWAPDTRARFDGAAMIAWIVLLVVSVLPLLFGERALAPMRNAERLEERRVRAATLAGLTLACAVVYTALFTYTAGELEYKADFSYFRTARPSESTKNVAQSLDEPVRVMAFFPQLNEVGNEVAGYLRELERDSGGKLTIEMHDRLLVPAIAKEAKVTQDGTVVLMRGTSRETLTVGHEMKAAMAKLKSLDGDFQKALLKVLRSQRTAYLTVGHGEINEPGGKETPEGKTAKTFRKVLESQNYSVKDLGLAQGLAGDVPKDAHVVIVLGPTKEVLPEEISSLKRYAERGGKVFVALDPESKIESNKGLADAFELTFKGEILATDDAKHFYPRRRNTSDRSILITNRFSSHASVSTLSKNSARAACVFPGASGIDKKEGTTAKIDFTVRAFGEVWSDADGDFEFDDGVEKRQVYNLAAAVTQPAKNPPEPKPGAAKDDKADETRAFVIGDVDAISDAALANEANLVLAVDAIRWLGGEESFSGAIATTEDVRIEHTKQKDIVWFYGTIFAAPSLVLGVGVWYSRRARKKTPAKPPKPEKAKAEKTEKAEKPEKADGEPAPEAKAAAKPKPEKDPAPAPGKKAEAKPAKVAKEEKVEDEEDEGGDEDDGDEGGGETEKKS